MRAVSLLASTILVAAGPVWWQTKPTIEQTTKPLALQAARSKCPIPLPDEATNIQYAYYSDVTVHQSFVRFEIPYEIGVSHVEAVFREHASRMKWPFKSPAEGAIINPPRLSLTPAPE